MYLQNRNLTFKLQEVGDGRVSFHERDRLKGRFVGQKSWSLQKVSVIKRTEKAGEVEGCPKDYEKINKIQSANLDGSQLKTTTQT